MSEGNKHIARRNAESLDKELRWLSRVINTRIKLYFEDEHQGNRVEEMPMPPQEKGDSLYADLINYCNMGFAERLVLILAIAPHIKPEILDYFLITNKLYSRGYSEFGGLKGDYHSGFLPTVETAMFLLTGGDVTKRLAYAKLFEEDCYLLKQNILEINLAGTNDEPVYSAALKVSQEYLSLLTTGDEYRPVYSEKFPAERLTSRMEWDDLVVDQGIYNDLLEIKAWIEHGERLLYEFDLAKKVKKGFRALFYGPPGTGKTLAVTLLAKETGLDAYRVDLSKLVSKYIGETEKNLANVFKQAENKNWILFFDEADSIFGKRSSGSGGSSGQDRYANQSISYLLQRIEDYPGVIILATNLKNNMDEAFFRRIQSMIFFKKPDVDLRFNLWKKAFPTHFQLDASVDLEEIAYKYDMAGGAITNVVRYCSLMALQRGNNTVIEEDLIKGIKKEFVKEGKMV